jgi:hypothetical protein
MFAQYNSTDTRNVKSNEKTALFQYYRKPVSKTVDRKDRGVITDNSSLVYDHDLTENITFGKL